MIGEIEKRKISVLFESYPIEFAYLFGSCAKGTAGKMSDVDIGVYFNEGTTKSERFDFRLDLAGETGKILRTDRVDLVSVNDSPLSLQFSMIQEGRLLFSREDLKRSLFEAKTMSLYFDRSYYVKREARATLHEIAAEGIL